MWFPNLGHPVPKDVDISSKAHQVSAGVSWVTSPVGVFYFPRGVGSINIGGAMHSLVGWGVLDLPVDLNQFGHCLLPNE